MASGIIHSNMKSPQISNGGETIKLTANSGVRGILVMTSATANRNGMYIIHGGTSTAISVIPILASSVFTYDNSTNGVLELTFSTALFVYFINLREIDGTYSITR